MLQGMHFLYKEYINITHVHIVWYTWMKEFIMTRCGNHWITKDTEHQKILNVKRCGMLKITNAKLPKIKRYWTSNQRMSKDTECKISKHPKILKVSMNVKRCWTSNHFLSKGSHFLCMVLLMFSLYWGFVIFDIHCFCCSVFLYVQPFHVKSFQVQSFQAQVFDLQSF